MSGEPVVSARSLTRVYELGEERVRALDGVDIEIARAEMVAIVGPSGSGKSTLMHLIGCLDSPTSGSVSIEGRDVSRLSERELARIRNESIGFVFQSFNLLPRLDLVENAALPLLYAGLAPKERRERARELLERVGLGDRLGHKPAQLSGGQRQRAAIARALACDPTILLADEPTGALDTATGEHVLELFRGIQRAGTTVIVVTHDHDVAGMCDRVIRLRDGKVEAQGAA